MAKRIELSHAEVQAIYGTQDQAYREFKSPKGDGILFSFNVKTKINDRNEKSPWVFDNCSYWADTSEKAEIFKKNVSIGNVLDIKGFADRQKSKKEENKWFDNINVREIITVQASSPAGQSEDDLPF